MVHRILRRKASLIFIFISRDGNEQLTTINHSRLTKFLNSHASFSKQRRLTEVVDGDAGENALTVATVARSKKAVLEAIMLI